MRTLLNNNNCILHSEFKPLEESKEGEKVMHYNRVESLTFFKDKYDNNGNYITTEKIIIDSSFLSEIRKAINEIEKEQKLMTYENELPW